MRYSTKIFLFIILSIGLVQFAHAEDACKTKTIRGPVPGFGPDRALHPDYISAAQNNPKRPNLGKANIVFCDGVKMQGLYHIYPTGAISIIYSEMTSYPQSSKSDCELMSEPFKEICKTAKSITDIVVAMDAKNLNSSQKFTILHELLETKSCMNLHEPILRELSRLSALPLLKKDAFEMPLEIIQKKFLCNLVVSEGFEGDRFVRLLSQETDYSFGILKLNKNNEIVGFQPLQPLDDIANLLKEDPCSQMIRQLVNLPEASPEKQTRLELRMKRLREFDALPKLDPYPYPAFAKDTHGAVKQGQGRVSNEPLHTTGMMPCIGIAVLNRHKKKAFLIHADADTDLESLIKNLSQQIGEGSLEAVIAGGDRSSISRDTLYRTLIALDKYQIPVLKYRFNHDIDSLAVDPKSGEFY